MDAEDIQIYSTHKKRHNWEKVLYFSSFSYSWLTVSDSVMWWEDQWKQLMRLSPLVPQIFSSSRLNQFKANASWDVRQAFYTLYARFLVGWLPGLLFISKDSDLNATNVQGYRISFPRKSQCKWRYWIKCMSFDILFSVCF